MSGNSTLTGRRGWCGRWYGCGLRWYPAEHRRRFGEDMRNAFAAQVEDARGRGIGSLATLLVRTAAHLCWFGTAERVRQVRLRIGTTGTDLRLGFRRCLRDPGSSLGAAGVLALGFGVLATAFALLQGTVLRGLPFEEAEQLVHFERRGAERGGMPVVPHDLVEWRAAQTSFEGLAAFVEALAILGDQDPAAVRVERHEGVAIEPEAFGLLRVTAAHGRAFTAADASPGADPVLLLSDRVWRRSFGADPSIVGRQVIVNGRSTRVVGIMPASFGFPIDEAFWVPLRVDPSAVRRGEGRLDVFGRLRPGVSFDAARSEFDVIAANLAAAYAENRDITVDMKTFREEYIGEEFSSRMHMILLGAGLVLLIAVVNASHLLVARSEGRIREAAVQVALGASRGRMVVQTAGEVLTLSVLGGAAGLAVSMLALSGVRLAWPSLDFFDLPHGTAAPFWWSLQLDNVTMAMTTACVLATTVVASLLVSVRLFRLRDGAILSVSARGASRARSRGAQVVVALQLAMMTALVVPVLLAAASAASLERSVAPIANASVYSARISMPTDPATMVPLILERLQQQSTLADAVLTTAIPFERARSVALSTAATADQPRDDRPSVRIASVSPRFFSLFGVQPLSGRLFSTDDGAGAEPVLLINERAAARHFAGTNPVGQRVRLGDGSTWLTVVGVVPDLWMDGDRTDRQEGVYLPLHQSFATDPAWRSGRWGSVAVLGRARGGVRETEFAVQRAAAVVSPAPAVFDQSTMAERVDRHASRYRMYGHLLTALGAAALLLAVSGIYGVNRAMAMARAKEIGIQMALGASRYDVFRGVVRRSTGVLALGVVGGLAAAFWMAGGLAQMFFGLDVHAPWVFATAALAAVGSAVVAIVLPVRAVSRRNPVALLRLD
jgi:predicted permease